MNTTRGMTLIEVVIFIILMGIVATSVLLGMNTVLRSSSEPGAILAASQLANARMNIILQQGLVNGFASISDPCASSPPDACTGLSLTGFTVNSDFVTASGITTATVTVTGNGNATLVMRFVQ